MRTALAVYGCCTAAANATLVNYQTYFGGTWIMGDNGKTYVGGNKTTVCGVCHTRARGEEVVFLGPPR